MGENGQAAAAFDGVIKSLPNLGILSWPQDQALTISIIPTDKTAFLRYMSCELFKNQNITEPKKQAENSVNYAKILYSVLSSNGLMN